MNRDLLMKFYYNYALGQMKPVESDPRSQQMAAEICEQFVKPLGLVSEANILDLGYASFVDALRDRGYDQAQAITADFKIAESYIGRDTRVIRGDPNFPQVPDASQDLVIQAYLHHSPCPYFALLEYNRILRPGAHLILIVPFANSVTEHEAQHNSLSVLGRLMWINLLNKTGFDHDIHKYHRDPLPHWETHMRDSYFVFQARRTKSIDMK